MTAETSLKRKLSGFDAAFEKKLDVQSVKACLELIVGWARKELTHLLSGDKNIDYFTFLEFEGELPWKHA